MVAELARSGGVKTPPPQRAAGRRALAKKKEALPDGSFPIPNVSYLKKAIRAVGRAAAGKRPALARLIRARGRQLGAWNVVKGSWADNTQGATAMANAYISALREFAAVVPDVGSTSGPYTTGQDMSSIAKMHGHPGKKCWDPDGDGDCDLTAQGDSDHDYWSSSGTQLKSVPGKPLKTDMANDGDDDEGQGGSLYQRIYQKLLKKGIPDARAQMMAQNAVKLIQKRRASTTTPAAPGPVESAGSRDGRMDVAFRPGPGARSRTPGPSRSGTDVTFAASSDDAATKNASAASMLANPQHVLQHLVASHRINQSEVSAPIAEHQAFHDAANAAELAESHTVSDGHLAHDYSGPGQVPSVRQSRKARR